MNRAVVSVATKHYIPGLRRLERWLKDNDPETRFVYWENELPPGAISHYEKPFAFKAHALWAAVEQGAELILWADACILPIRSMEPLWEKIERDGYWICNNGWLNSDWTADSAYPDLFPGVDIDAARIINEKIKHVVAGTFGLDVRSYKGAAALSEYLRLAQTDAFCGPTWNSNHPESRKMPNARPCGDETVRGHRHDQSALSCIAWRLGMELSDPPLFFSYRQNDEKGNRIEPDLSTILLADSTY